MIARTSATVAPGGVLGALRCEPPLTLRRVTSDDPGICALCLVGTAAGPLAGDDLALHLQLQPGARATVQATGASIAQGRGGAPAAVRWRADLGPGARLRADPGGLVICAGAHVDVEVSIALGAEAAVDWRELVVLGRTADVHSGTGSLRWDVTREGRPVLRQRVDLAGPREPALWRGIAGGRRVLAAALISDPAVAARTVVAAATAVAARVDEHTVLVTVLADSAAEAARRLEDLRERATGALERA